MNINPPVNPAPVCSQNTWVTPDYDIAHSFVIGDPITDMQLAKFRLQGFGSILIPAWVQLKSRIKLISSERTPLSLNFPTSYLNTSGSRPSSHMSAIPMKQNCCNGKPGWHRKKRPIETGLGFDHMLEQIARHGNIGPGYCLVRAACTSMNITPLKIQALHRWNHCLKRWGKPGY